MGLKNREKPVLPHAARRDRPSRQRPHDVSQRAGLAYTAYSLRSINRAFLRTFVVISSSRVKSLLCTMDEPPAQVPRHTTSLTRLWRRHDLADSVTKFLPTQALAMLPNLSRSFEQDKFRMLLVAMRASKSAAACTGALLSTLQTSGRDAGHYHRHWDNAKTGKGGWKPSKELKAAMKASQVSAINRTETYRDLPDGRFLRMERIGESDNVSRQFLYQGNIGKSCPSGQRRCVRRVRVQFAYEGPTDNWGTSVGSSFCLLGPAHDVHKRTRTILKFYTKFSPDGLRIICTGGGQTRTLLTVPKSRIASQIPEPLEMVTVDATLDWNLQVAHVIATTRDGTEFRKTVAFERLPLRGLNLSLRGQGVHLFGDVDVWYYDMPAPTARRCPLPFAPCRDDELRFDVGACLGSACGFFLGDEPLGVPHREEDDYDY